MKNERRFLHTEVRAVKQGEDQPVHITGYAAVFDDASQISKYFNEVIRPGAFDRALKEKQDVRALFNHDEDKVLGRTKSGTLTLSVDKRGLKYDIEAPNTTIANDLIESINRGDIDASSFGFIAQEQRWTEETKDGSTTYLRELLDVDLLDVSPVTYPAYTATTAGTRSKLFEGFEAPKEIRAKMQQECRCECDECEDGNCAECTVDGCTEETCSCKQRSAAAAEAEVTAYKERAELRLRLQEKQ